jgi:hypothetical protein
MCVGTAYVRVLPFQGLWLLCVLPGLTLEFRVLSVMYMYNTQSVNKTNSNNICNSTMLSELFNLRRIFCFKNNRE